MPQAIEDGGEVGRHRARHGQLGAGEGVAKPQPRRVEHDPRRRARIAAVGRVAEEGQARAREMDADLVLPTRPRPGLDEHAAGPRLHDLEVRDRGGAVASAPGRATGSSTRQARAGIRPGRAVRAR